MSNRKLSRRGVYRRIAAYRLSGDRFGNVFYVYQLECGHRRRIVVWPAGRKAPPLRKNRATWCRSCLGVKLK